MVAPAVEELNDPGYIFIQDNASIHTALTIQDWFRNAALICLDWPPYSPDLNLIKHAWAKLKTLLDKEFPEISRGLGKGEYDLEQLGSVLQACWDMIPKEFFNALYQSMPSRVRACYKAKG
jgi:transposase